MCGYKDLYKHVFLFICTSSVLCDATTSSTESLYTINLPDTLCSQCPGHARTHTSGCPDKPKTQEQIMKLKYRLRDLKHLMEEGATNASLYYGAEKDFLPVNITALRREMECRRLQKFVRKRSELDRILHKTYIRLLILLGHLNISNDILEQDTGYVNKQGQKSTRLLEDIMCKVHDLSMYVRSSEIKKKVCSTLNSIFTGGRHCPEWKLKINTKKEERDYALSILTQGQQTVNDIIHQLGHVDTALDECSCTTKHGMRCPRNGSVEKRSLKRNSKKSRKGRKNRKGKKDKKNRKVRRNKKDRKGRQNRGKKSRRQRNRKVRMQTVK